MALGLVINGALLFITIIGISFSKIYFELARLCLFPVGAQVVKKA